MNKRPYQIGVIGAGARGEAFARQLFRGHPRAQLFGVCDIDADRLKKFCDYCELHNARQFTDTRDFLCQPNMDAVVITTPEFTHGEIAIAAMAAGKHIYLEKAMAQDSATCRAIMRAHEASDVTAFLGFNMRAVNVYSKLKEVVDSGVLGKIVHISSLEQLQKEHGAAFMRRYHRHSKRSGGLMNTKCAHDLDLIQWLIGHEHKITRIASFGGSSIFTPDKQPAKFCHECSANCSYRDRAGFVFPVNGDQPIHHQQVELYGGDLCVYDPDKDLVDNQTVIMEWDNGIRGNFNLQMFQHVGRRETTIWGERGIAIMNTWPEANIKVINSITGDQTDHRFGRVRGGHGGSDVKMIDLFLDSVEGNGPPTSGLAAGLAATLIAEKSDIARRSGEVVTVTPEEFH